jgi:hypothetical protein
MGRFKEQLAWSDQFLLEVRRIVGAELVMIGSPRQDLKEATDLLAYKVAGSSLALRIRRNKFIKEHGTQITIRAHHDDGHEVELSKLLKGFGDMFFYGFAHATRPGKLARYFVLDLAVFRWILFNRPDAITIDNISNDDGTHAAVFDLRDFIEFPDLIITSNFKLPTWEQTSRQHARWLRFSKPVEQMINMDTFEYSPRGKIITSVSKSKPLPLFPDML